MGPGAAAGPLNGRHAVSVRGGARAGVGENAANLRLVERLRQQVVRAQVQGLRPETDVGVGIGDNHLRPAGAAASQEEDIKPCAIGKGGFGQDDVVVFHLKLGVRAPTLSTWSRPSGKACSMRERRRASSGRPDTNRTPHFICTLSSIKLSSYFTSGPATRR